MDRTLFEIIVRGDRPTFLNYIQGNENLMIQTEEGSLNTILHLAARFGHEELASEVLKLRPEMASAENAKLETPLFEACREGWMNIVKILVLTDPRVVYKVNRINESVLHVACQKGRVEIVKQLIKDHPWLLMLEVDGFTTSLHVAAFGGHTDIVKELVTAREDFAWKKNVGGQTPLHVACSKGHLDITRELLKLDPDLSCLQDNDGRTPLHWAAIRGRINILDEILCVCLQAADRRTSYGETVLHLAVRYNQLEAVKYLTETLNITKLVNVPDNDGNTILHLATSGKLTTMIIYLLKIGVDVNAINRRGYTALDVVESDASNSGTLQIVPALQEAGAKTCEQLHPTSRDIQIQPLNDAAPTPSIPSPSSWQKLKPHHDHSPTNHHHHHRRRRRRHIEAQNEGIRNARNTITVVAVLIATVTFAGGINPPGGFNEETGKTIMGRQTSFKVFMVCNIVALFLSLGVVIFLVSIIPFRRKPLMRLLAVTHKVMWLSMAFMAAAYIAGIWTILPRGRGMVWVLVTLVSVGGGGTLVIFGGLGVLLGRHWVKKLEWRKRKEKNGSPSSSVSRVEEMRMIKRGSRDSTSNSDLDSSDQDGFHPY